MGPDIVYPIRRGDHNEELRYSLRSLSNLRHNRVWMVGHKPAFVNEKVNHWPRPQKASKYRNATEGLVELTREIGSSLSRPFLLWNDDFYCMAPLRGKVPVLHMGPVEEVIERYKRNRHMGAYWRGMVSTFELMQKLGIREPLSYELHIPIPVYRRPLLEAWEKGKELEVLHIRTLYGNLAELGGTYMEDVKVYRDTPAKYEDWPWLSSNDDMTLTPMRHYLQQRFPTPSPYEYP